MPHNAFCFHLSPTTVSLWANNERLDPDLADLAKGNCTFDNFRFLRLHFETAEASSREDWVPYQKGGEFQPFYCPTPLRWNFTNRGKENRVNQIKRSGTDAQVKQSSSRWGHRGLCYPYVTSVGFSPRLLPDGNVVGHASIGIFPKKEEDTLALLAFLSSTYCQDLIYAMGRARMIERNTVGGIPVSEEKLLAASERLSELAKNGVVLGYKLEASTETSPVFNRPFLDGEAETVIAALAQLFDELDDACRKVLWGSERAPDPVSQPRSNLVRKHLTTRFVPKNLQEHTLRWCSFALGIAFGRFNDPEERYEPPSIEDLFRDDSWKPAGRHGTSDAPSVLVDDAGTDLDIIEQLQVAIGRQVCWPKNARLEEDALRDIFARKFFDYHVRTYSLAGRKAPIYWQLGTPSNSYSVWCFYHRLTRDTLFRVVNDFITPKLDHEERKLNTLRQEAGADPSSKQRKEIDAQETFVAELRAFLTEVDRIAPLWNPNLNDGVIINFAPLWRLVPQHKAWQKECKKVWDKLVKGDYDWAHLAMHLWPERVVPRCQDDRSLAIAHGLEDEFWCEDDDETWKKRKPPEGGWEPAIKKLVEDRSSPGVKAALTSLLTAPAPTGNTKSRRRKATK